MCNKTVICKLFFVYLHRYAILDLLRNLEDIIFNPFSLGSREPILYGFFLLWKFGEILKDTKTYIKYLI